MQNCVVDFQTKDLSGMENSCITDCIRKAQVCTQEMNYASGIPIAK